MDSYADAPISITEARAERTHHSETWTPRDCLVSMLRQIDRGEINPEELVIIWTADKNENALNLHRSIAGPCTTLEVLGMLSRASHQMQVDP